MIVLRPIGLLVNIQPAGYQDSAMPTWEDRKKRPPYSPAMGVSKSCSRSRRGAEMESTKSIAVGQPRRTHTVG